MTERPAGILNVDKPWGWTSHDVVGLVRRLTGQRQVGHAGTLDPRATGVLLVAVGAATRLSDYLMHGRKCYLASIRLGLRTTTDDSEGAAVETRPAAGLDRSCVLEALAGFLGRQQQVPPAFAAIKTNGVPAYKQARSGAVVELAPRWVRIDGLALRAMGADTLDLIVWCGAGTYIRALARDLGDVLGCGAHLAALRRLSSGSFTVETAVGVTELRALAADGQLEQRLTPPDVALEHLPALIADERTVQDVRHGRLVAASPLGELDGAPARGELDGAPAREEPDSRGEARIYGCDGRLVALVSYDAGQGGWQPRKVFA